MKQTHQTDNRRKDELIIKINSFYEKDISISEKDLSKLLLVSTFNLHIWKHTPPALNLLLLVTDKDHFFFNLSACVGELFSYFIIQCYFYLKMLIGHIITFQDIINNNKLNKLEKRNEFFSLPLKDIICKFIFYTSPEFIDVGKHTKVTLYLSLQVESKMNVNYFLRYLMLMIAKNLLSLATLQVPLRKNHVGCLQQFFYLKMVLHVLDILN